MINPSVATVLYAADVAADRERLLEMIFMAMADLAALIPEPSLPEVDQWPCTSSADRECLQRAYVTLRKAWSATGQLYEQAHR